MGNTGEGGSKGKRTRTKQTVCTSGLGCGGNCKGGGLGRFQGKVAKKNTAGQNRTKRKVIEMGNDIIPRMSAWLQNRDRENGKIIMK